ncbi:hypothetical protein L7F22_047067 [Adiantum nelumboides]|nr:hypothetical protein [Adiantum nelumboides]
MPDQESLRGSTLQQVDAGQVIANASGGRALRGLQMPLAQQYGPHQDAEAQQLGLLNKLDVSPRILLEPPEDVVLMGPTQPMQSFVCCFSRSEESLAFRQDVSSRGWSTALSLHAKQLLRLFSIGANYASYTATSAHHPQQLSTLKRRQVCFVHCLLIPKKSFQIPASKMRLCQEVLNLASRIHSHNSAGDFLQAYHSHVSVALHLGRIFFHELTIKSVEETTFELLVEECSNVITTKFGLSVPLLGEGAGARGGYNSVQCTSEQESQNQASCKIESINETVVALGLSSSARDANEFQRKHNEDPFTWIIIDKEADRVDTLVSIWEIILTQPAVTLSSCGYDAKLLQQAAHHMSNYWQDEISGWHMAHPILSTLLSRNYFFMRLPAVAGGTQLIAPPAQLEAVNRIQPLPKRIPLANLSEHLQALLGPELDDAAVDSTNYSANLAIKSCLSQVDSEKARRISASDQTLYQIIMGYGFDHSGNLLNPLNTPQLRSLIYDLQKSQAKPVPAQPSIPAGQVPANNWPDSNIGPQSNDFLPNGAIKYFGDVVVDRPFLQQIGSMKNGDLVLPDVTEQARRLLDCLRHRVNPLQHLSQIRGQVLGSASMNDMSWDDDAAEEESVHEGSPVPPVTAFELLIELLKRSDLSSQVALFKLLLEQRAAVPLVHPETSSGEGVQSEAPRTNIKFCASKATQRGNGVHSGGCEASTRKWCS